MSSKTVKCRPTVFVDVSGVNSSNWNKDGFVQGVAKKMAVIWDEFSDSWLPPNQATGRLFIEVVTLKGHKCNAWEDG